MKELWNGEVERQNLAEQMLRFLGPEFIPNHRKCLQEKKDVIFGQLVGGLFGIWLVCRWFG